LSFEWAYKGGDKTADDLDYVPMPATVKTAIEKSWSEIKDSSAKLLLTNKPDSWPCLV
jgi:phosphate transport system substrate-binding protein